MTSLSAVPTSGTEKEPTKRQLAAQETKKKLQRAMLELIREKGFSRVNVEEITQRAGVAKGSFYTYFKRKEDIVLESCRLPFDEIYAELQAMEKPLTAKLARYVHRFMEIVETSGIHTCREWFKNVIDPQLTEDKKWFYDEAMLKGILAQAVKNGELKKKTPVDLLTHIIISQLYGMAITWVMSDGEFKPMAWTASFCKVQLPALFEPYLKKAKS